MADVNLSREDQLAAFFVQRGGDLLGRTRLMKLMYLADYEARRYLGRPISNIAYIWYDYGPFDNDLYDRISRLEEAGVLVEEEVIYPNGTVGYLYTSGPKRVANEFSAAEAEVLSFVARKYSNMQLRELLDDVVYQTEPMLKAKKDDARNRPLDMEMVNGVKARELTIGFEDLLERSAQLRGGGYLSHEQAMSLVGERIASAAA